MKRNEAIAPTPVFVSQISSEAVLGIDARRFLELLREHPSLGVVPCGKLRLVEVSVVRELLRGLASTTGGASAAVAEAPAAEPETADEVLARLGRRKTA